MFGLRLAIGLLVDGSVRTATELSQALLERSGIRDLQRVLTDRYAARAQALKARSALAALRVIGEELERLDVAGASDVIVAVDRLEAASQELGLLRLLHLVLSGTVELGPSDRAEVDRLCGPGRSAERLGLAAGASSADVRAAALVGIRWRSRAASPLSDRRVIEAAEIVSRAYEEICHDRTLRCGGGVGAVSASGTLHRSDWRRGIDTAASARRRRRSRSRCSGSGGSSSSSGMTR
jgi:hypothetical protein